MKQIALLRNVKLKICIGVTVVVLILLIVVAIGKPNGTVWRDFRTLMFLVAGVRGAHRDRINQFLEDSNLFSNYCCLICRYFIPPERPSKCTVGVRVGNDYVDARILQISSRTQNILWKGDQNLVPMSIKYVRQHMYFLVYDRACSFFKKCTSQTIENSRNAP